MRAGDNYDLAEHLARIEDGLVDLGDYIRQQAARRPPPRQRSPIRIEVPVPYPMRASTPQSAYEPQSVHLSGASTPHASERAPSTVVPVSPTTLVGPLASTATPAPSTRALTVDISEESAHMFDGRAVAPSIMSVRDDDGDVRIVEPFTVTMSPIRLSSPSTLTPSISILSSAHSDSVWDATPSSPRVPYTPTTISSVPLPSPPISTPSELSTIPLSSPSIPVAPAPSPATQPSPSVTPPMFPSPPTRTPWPPSPSLSDITVQVTGPSIQQLKDALGNLRNLAGRLMDQQQRASDAIEELRKRPPPAPIEIPFPMPAPPVSIPQAPTPIIPHLDPPYAPILSDIADALRNLANLGQRPPKAKTESVFSDALSSTTGTSIIRDRFDNLRDRLIPPLVTAPSQDSLRSDNVLRDPFRHSPPAGDHREASPIGSLRVIPTVHRPAAGRQRSPSPEPHRARTAPLPRVDLRDHSWHPPHGLRSEHEPHYPESSSETETEEREPKLKRPPREAITQNVPVEKKPTGAIRPDEPPKVGLLVCQSVES